MFGMWRELTWLIISLYALTRRLSDQNRPFSLDQNRPFSLVIVMLFFKNIY